MCISHKDRIVLFPDHKHRRAPVPRALVLTALALVAAPAAQAQEEEDEAGERWVEVVVSAQRVPEVAQEVPIAITALTSDMLRDSQILGPSDLQFSAGNVSFTATNFGDSSFSIRGIGKLVIGTGSESGVSFHLNEIPLTANLNTLEFFDVRQVEIMRGPQGTLFGRNATGGAINVVANLPELERWEGHVNLEFGSYRHQRTQAAINIPVGGRMAVRLAGFQLRRDGYVKNLAYGQTDAAGNTLPGIDEDIDGRDVLGGRVSWAWELTDRARLWALYGILREDDDRVRISNQVCKRNPLPTSGCLPDEFAFETPHLSATVMGIFAGAAGALPLGADGSDPSLYDYPRPRITGFRQMHTDLEPRFRDDEDVFAFGFTYEFDTMTATLLGSRREAAESFTQDYGMDVGARFLPTAFNPSGVWPVSAPGGEEPGVDWLSGRCAIQQGTTGTLGGCTLPVDGSRAFVYDQPATEEEYWTLEGKVSSAFNGPFNFLLGASGHENKETGGFQVFGNGLDLVAHYGVPPLNLPPLYPGYFYTANDPAAGELQESLAIFGEIYFDITDRLRFTAGLRHNREDKAISDTSVLFNAADANAALGGLLGGRVWIRQSLFSEMAAIAGGTAAGLSVPSQRLLEFWNATGSYQRHGPTAIALMAAIGAAQQIGARVAAGALPLAAVPAAIAGLPLPPTFQQTVAALLSRTPAVIAADAGLAAGGAALRGIAAAVPPAPGFRETRFVTGSPDSASWQAPSGRVGFDLQVTGETLVYAFHSRGYKPGGFNEAIPPVFQDSSSFTYEPEEVSAFEVGVKNDLYEGQLTLNASFFVYDYQGLQVSQIKNNSSINVNVDADVTGFELEGLWRPEAVPGLSVDFAYGWLRALVADSEAVDPINRTAGNADYVLLNNIDPGSLTGINYIAREAQITAALVSQALASGAALDIRNGTAVESTSYPANASGVAIPALFSREFLRRAGVETLDGIPIDLDGKQLPNSPEHGVKLGIAHTWVIGGADLLTLRWDLYWQSGFHARMFNTRGDAVAGWDQHNASMLYESGDGRWEAKLWVRNVFDDANVTGKYLTTDTSGLFRNYFLTEPRVFGVTVRYDFGN